jgi:hypothetical protein
MKDKKGIAASPFIDIEHISAKFTCTTPIHSEHPDAASENGIISGVSHALLDWNNYIATDGIWQQIVEEIIRNHSTAHFVEHQKQGELDRYSMSIDTDLPTPNFYKKIMLADARRDLEKLVSNYKSLSELSEVFSSINNFLKTGKGRKYKVIHFCNFEKKRHAL